MSEAFCHDCWNSFGCVLTPARVHGHAVQTAPFVQKGPLFKTDIQFFWSKADRCFHKVSVS